MFPDPDRVTPPVGLGVLCPGFTGTPYLATRIEPDLFHILLLPREWPLYSQLNVAFRQAEANRLPTLFVMAPDTCLWFQPGGAVVPARADPHDTAIAFGKLEACERLPYAPDLIEREAELRAFAYAQRDRTVWCDPDRGGWVPSEEEIRSLSGAGPDGVPRGLARCAECDEWRGRCLDPSRVANPLVLPVACACDNANECASCGELLFERRLQANWYDEEDGMLRYVPGFHALEHVCGG